MNIKKNKKTVITFIIILIIVTTLIFIGLSTANYKKAKSTIKEYECIKKGNVCSSVEIYDGVEVEVDIKKNIRYRFYVISNDKEKMTLIMSNNVIDKSDWHNELINMKGPTEALGELFSRTKTWENIDSIKKYTYEDYGLKNFVETCDNLTTEPNYDCNNGNTRGRGYKSLNISNGNIEFVYNLDAIDGMEPADSFSYTQTIKARMITLEEILNVAQEKELPRWLTVGLKEKEGYWTMTSSTAMNTQYSSGAIAIANKDNKTSIESLYVMNSLNEGYKIGIRPVITISKQ